MENIYELLNHAEMNLKEFENQKLSDYECKTTKKHILKEVRTMKNSKKIWKKTFAAAACACIMVGMGTTISVAAGWLSIPDSFKTILGINTDEKLEVANTMGISTDIVAEDHGYKVSAKGIIGDGKNMGIVFQIEKSDGSTLLDNGTVPAAVDFKIIDSGNYSHAAAGKVDGSNYADSIEYYTAFIGKVCKSMYLYPWKICSYGQMMSGQMFQENGNLIFLLKYRTYLLILLRDRSLDMATAKEQ